MGRGVEISKGKHISTLLLCWGGGFLQPALCVGGSGMCKMGRSCPNNSINQRECFTWKYRHSGVTEMC